MIPCRPWWRRLLGYRLEAPAPVPDPVPPAEPAPDRVAAMLDALLVREGGFVDDPVDRGGPTNYGITLGTLRAWRGTPTTTDDVRQLSETEARAIYRSEYYEGPRIDALPAKVQPITFDAAVNHGPGRAVRMLQGVAATTTGKAITIDGRIGPETLRVVSLAEPVDLVAGMVDTRRRFYREIAANDQSQRRFLRGWLKRVDAFV